MDDGIQDKRGYVSITLPDGLAPKSLCYANANVNAFAYTVF